MHAAGNDAKPELRNAEHKPIWSQATAPCQNQSTKYYTPSVYDYGFSSVQDWYQAKDVCQYSEFAETHGFFASPGTNKRVFLLHNYEVSTLLALTRINTFIVLSRYNIVLLMDQDIVGRGNHHNLDNDQLLNLTSESKGVLHQAIGSATNHDVLHVGTQSVAVRMRPDAMEGNTKELTCLVLRTEPELRDRTKSKTDFLVLESLFSGSSVYRRVGLFK